MSDLISRDSLVDKIRAEMANAKERSNEASDIGDDAGRFGFFAMYKLYQHVFKVVLDEPAVTMKPEERTKGKWQWLSSTKDRVPCEQEYVCSACGHKIIINNPFLPWENYCSNCGADMRGEDE